MYMAATPAKAAQQQRFEDDTSRFGSYHGHISFADEQPTRPDAAGVDSYRGARWLIGGETSHGWRTPTPAPVRIPASQPTGWKAP
jgi:hypothetical protein